MSEICLPKFRGGVAGKIIGSQVEGAFYSRWLFDIIADLIERHYDWKSMEVAYAREEVYFSTIVWNLKGKDIKIFKKRMFTWCPWERQFTMNVRIHEVKKWLRTENNVFSVKRVERNISDCIRAMMRQQYDYFGKESEYIENVKKYKEYELIIQEIKKEIRLHINVVKKGIIKIKGRIRSTS